MEFMKLPTPMAVASFLVMLTISSASFNNISFIFNDFNLNNKSINLDGNATMANGLIQLTASQRDQDMSYSVGWATYNEPMHLWDQSTRNVADFSTWFTFIIDSLGNSPYADGFTFFLVPNGTQMNFSSEGGSLGLPFSISTPTNKSDNAYIAVEFDTYSNNWDPGYNDPGYNVSQPNNHSHIGININSLKSVVTDPWEWANIEAEGQNIEVGVLAKAFISYNSSSKYLNVLLVDDDNNSDNKSIPSLSYQVNLTKFLPEWVTFGFSGSTGLNFELHKIISWGFNSTLQIADPVGPTGPVAPGPSPLSIKQEGREIGLAVGLCIGGLVLVIVLVGFFRFWWCKRRNGEEAEESEDKIPQYTSGELEKESMGPKKFSYPELANATGNFEAEEKLGEGGFGGVYRGLLQSTGSYVAVKRISSGSKQGFKEYKSEIKIISRLRHRNLVQLIGWCHERRELLLVYEFMPNGSLDSHLFKGKSFIPWRIRYRIAQGLASAVLYLHEEWEQCVVHRDIKSSNIMLDSDFNAKLGDFGLARLVDHVKGSQTTVLAGTMGYMAPECSQTFRATKESDVYSFGVVCLEIACGRRPVEPRFSEDQIVLVRWVWSLREKGEMLKAADPGLGSNFNEREMERLLIIGLSCTLTDSHLRPSARQVLNVLESIAPLPVLPARDPVGLAASLSPLQGPGDQHQSLYTASSSNSNQANSYSQFSLHTGASLVPSSALYSGR